jgi:hypothetical protein
MRTIAIVSLLSAALVLSGTGCNDPLLVRDPDIVDPGDLSDSARLSTIRAGALGDFALSYSGDGSDGSGGIEGVIMYGGLLADEWINSETFPTRIEVDARTIQRTNANVGDWFRNLHRARRAAENAAARFEAQAPDDPVFPEMLSLAGFTYLFLAETFCSGVPLSRATPEGQLIYGTPLTTRQLLDTALARFDRALAVATDPDMTNLANVGKARAMLDTAKAGTPADFAAAAAVAATVPTDFFYSTEHAETTDRENNGVFKGNVIDERYSVADDEGVNGLQYQSVPDPRTPFERSVDVFGFDGETPQWDNLRYGSRSSPVTLATGVEARLIEAEAALQAGNGATFLAQLNDPRADPSKRTYFNSTRLGVPAIPVLANLTPADTTAAGGAVNLLFNERARWLWLTAHRLGDLRRLIRQYSRATESVFPTGPYFKGQFSEYGPDVNFPIYIDEENNPNFTTCIDRNP